MKGTSSVRVGPRVMLKVAGAAGPYLNVNGEADLKVEPGADPLWEVTGGLSLRGGLALLGFSKDAQILDYRLPTPIRTQRGGGFVETPPELAAPPPTLRGLGRIFPRPDLTRAPLDVVVTPVPITIVCAVQGPPVAGITGLSTVWFGLDDGTFVNAVDVAGAPKGGLPACVVPPAPGQQPRPQPQPQPPAPAVLDRDGDGVLDASDACPDARGVAPRGCPRVRGLALGPDGGYWLAAEDGGVFSFGVPFHGSWGGQPLNQAVVGIAPNPATRGGYWLAAADGGVFNSPTVPFHGSVGNMPLSRPVVGIAARPQGDGYWLAGADGGVFAFGAAPFIDSLPKLGIIPNAPIVGIAPTPSGNGYWLAGADGGVFAIGDAQYFGSEIGTNLNAPIVGIAPTPSGKGYWLVGADGGVFTKGDAGFFGARAGQPLNQPIVGLTPTATGAGYWLVAGDGGVFAFGDAVFRGGTAAG